MSYTVAPDDQLDAIAKRFGLQLAYLSDLNAVRRPTTQLYVGDVINLSSTHITSVGTQDGVFGNGAPPHPIPSQVAADQP